MSDQLPSGFLHFEEHGAFRVYTNGPERAYGGQVDLSHRSHSARLKLDLSVEEARWIAGQLHLAADAYELAERTSGVRGTAQSAGGLVEHGTGIWIGFCFFVSVQGETRMFQVRGCMDLEIWPDDAVHLVRTGDGDYWRIASVTPGDRSPWTSAIDWNELASKAMERSADDEPWLDPLPIEEKIPEFLRADSAVAA